VIKIRYADLPQGLHAQLRTRRRQTVIYLLPGLSPAQRQDALRRLIRTSRQGYGPRLRATGVALAVAGDVAKSTARNGLTAVRCHPLGSAGLAAFLTTAVVCYSLFVTVTVRFGPRRAVPPAAAGAAPSRPQYLGGSGRSPGGGASGPPGSQPAIAAPHGSSAAGSATGAGSVPSGSGPSGPGSSTGPVPTGTWPGPGGVLPSGWPGPSAGGSSPPFPAPWPVPSPASPGPQPPPRSNPGGLCLQLGPLGICIAG
jgi:hypothetical protein